ncbi:MFS transporter [Clostridium estertheticum]|uniref:MFS transporter n=1 Tax=Clostridium estertheticum TaxID=238834 RepID=UPI001C0D2BA2|nr:MFS transporter [Clostridium estertheticum]MBU3076048.1 MFS transporter [Clostridium estertheticum]MBU3166168.1 MFS transporter [Clostridium estertheticum]
MNNINADNSKNNKLWSKNFILLMIGNFFLFFGDNLLLPVLPVYVMMNGANSFHVGVVAAVFFGTSVLMRTFTSRVIRYVGKKTLLMVTISMFALAMVGYYLFAGLAMIIALRLFQGLGFGTSTTLYGASAASIIPRKKMGEGMGYFGLSISLAAVLGPCLGAAVVSGIDFKWIFLAAALLEVIAIILTHFIKIDNSKDIVTQKAEGKDFLSDIIEPEVIYESIFMLLIGLAMGSFATYVVLFAKEMNIKNIFVYFLATSVAEILVRLISGKVYDRKGMNAVMIPAAIVGIIGCIVMGNATNLIMVCIFGFLYGIAIGVAFPAMEASAMKKVAPNKTVMANATLYNFLDIGTGLGPLLFGAVVQMRGYSDAFFLCSLIFVTMLVILLFNMLLKKKKNVIVINQKLN